MGKQRQIISESKLTRIIKDAISATLEENVKYGLKIKNDIRSVLNEAYGISDEVEETFEDCKKNLLEVVKDRSLIRWKCDALGTLYKKGIIHSSLSGAGIVVQYVIYDFTDIEEFERMKSFYDFECEAKVEYGTVFLSSAAIGGELIVDTFDDSLQHELAHIYDYIKMGVSPINNPKDWDLYHSAVFLTNSNNNDLRIVGYALYSSFKAEQRGMINGLDAYIRNSPRSEHPFNLFYQTSACAYLKLILMAINILETDQDVSASVEERIDISTQKTIKILKDAYESFHRLIARVLWKYLEPYEETHIGDPNFEKLRNFSEKMPEKLR